MGCSITAAKNKISNTTPDWIRLAVMPLTKHYRTDLLSQNLRQLRTRLYTDNLFPKVNPITGYECAQIYTDDEGFICIVPLFRK